VYVRVGAAGWRCRLLDKHRRTGKEGDVEARDASFSSYLLLSGYELYRDIRLD